ncbi:MAG: hypothetical protein JXA10_14055 [Anaerolineae bacterium]|nr:hypothetical protein [Anaerolineae bacterium]
MTERDGSFRRLVEMVKEQQDTPKGSRRGRPPKNRVPTTGFYAVHLHSRMKELAKAQSEASVDYISTSDLYNDAARQLISDLHDLLGDEIQLPAGVMSIPGILGLRELVDRPVLTPIGELEFHNAKQHRTTAYFDQPVWDALMELSLRFGLRWRRAVNLYRLVELSAAWYLAGLEVEPQEQQT